MSYIVYSICCEERKHPKCQTNKNKKQPSDLSDAGRSRDITTPPEPPKSVTTLIFSPFKYYVKTAVQLMNSDKDEVE